VRSRAGDGRALLCAAPGFPPCTVEVGADAARELARLETTPDGSPAVAVVDRRVAELHEGRVRCLSRRVVVEGGEAAKQWPVLREIVSAVARHGLSRDGRLVAIGGGAVGDVAGLASALYLRGIELIQVPTTLLAMVDSSVGGKTAIDIPEGKNLVGAFHPARRVLVDLAFLDTLPEVELRCGIAEAIKVGIGLSAELFEALLRRRDAVLARDAAALADVVALAVAAKIRLVEADPREAGPRRLLNLGHTLGHALEGHSGYRLRHGLAVARGLHFALAVAERGGHLAPADAARARDLLAAYGFAPDPLPDFAELRPFLARDKKVRGGTLHFVVPTAIGASAVVEVQPAELERHWG
jgi:3-dehydroquinate synthase